MFNRVIAIACEPLGNMLPRIQRPFNENRFIILLVLGRRRDGGNSNIVIFVVAIFIVAIFFAVENSLFRPLDSGFQFARIVRLHDHVVL